MKVLAPQVPEPKWTVLSFRWGRGAEALAPQVPEPKRSSQVWFQPQVAGRKGWVVEALAP